MRSLDTGEKRASAFTSIRAIGSDEEQCPTLWDAPDADPGLVHRARALLLMCPSLRMRVLAEEAMRHQQGLNR